MLYGVGYALIIIAALGQLGINTSSMAAVVGGAALAVGLALRDQLASFASGVLLLPYLTLSGGPAGFTSMARFNLASFPLFICMAQIASRVPWLTPGLIGMFGALLFSCSALFAQWQWVG